MRPSRPLASFKRVLAALALMGKCERTFRLPLCETDDAKLAQMKKTLASLGLV